MRCECFCCVLEFVIFDSQMGIFVGAFGVNDAVDVLVDAFL